MGWLRRRADEAFVREAYRELLGRDADPGGLATQVAALAGGTSRDELRAALADSPEGRAHRAHVRGVREDGDPSLPDLTAERPDRYELGVDLHGRTILAFRATGPADFDWLEQRIVETGYYDTDGVWTLEIDLDKRLMAELIAAVRPRSVLELGCSSGAVLAGLAERGVEVTGVDVSEHARAAAPAAVRDRILLGDLLTLDLPGGHDAVVGLDVFEHLNPNRIDAYVRRLADLLADGGWCVANIPVYGEDPVFGNVFLDYLEEPASSTLFHRVHVDDRGYPLHGHLIWATWDWWVDRFAAAGLHRRPAVEEALHARYRDHWREHTPARQSLFVFRKGDARDGEDALVAAIRAEPSSVLSSHAPPPG